MGYENAKTMVTPEILYPPKNRIVDNESYYKIVQAVVDSARKTTPFIVGKNIVDIWKICLKILKDMRLGLIAEDSAILAMDAAKKIWKEYSS